MSDPIESKNEDVIGGFLEEGDLARDEHSIIRIEDGIIRRETRNIVRFFDCGHAVQRSEDIGGRCSICDAIICIACFRQCQRCRRSLCNTHQKMKNGAAYCDGCHLFVTFFGDRSDSPREIPTYSRQQNQSNLPNTRTRNRSRDWFRLLFGDTI